MKNWMGLAVTVLAGVAFSSGCSAEESGTKEVVPMQAPEEVVQVIFEAARTGKPFSISELCDTLADLNPDVRRICELDTAHFAESEFSRYFSAARIDSVQRRGTDSATVFFRYGPESEREGAFFLVRRGEVWKLRNMNRGADAKPE